MKYLLDTHLLVWIFREPAKLPKPLSRVLAAAQDDFYFSSISLAEFAIKNSVGKRSFIVSVARAEQDFLEAGLIPMPFNAKHAARLDQLGDVHSDPFDRMLVAQAKAEEITLLTVDEKLAGFGRHVQVF